MTDADYIKGKRLRAHCDARRKHSHCSELPLVNEPLECVLILGRLNEAISTMLALQDDYYTNYIWNSNTEQQELLKENSLTEEWFSRVESKLTLLRSILMGENYNWDEAYAAMYRNALGEQVYWKEFYEERTKELEAKIREMEKKNE